MHCTARKTVARNVDKAILSGVRRTYNKVTKHGIIEFSFSAKLVTNDVTEWPNDQR